ncbi:MAG: amidohydrolase family protein, partial [Deltaproteobacteria bacterium]|nr:amidohydrolase family protein [Deltaproteobacteria bacterium]
RFKALAEWQRLMSLTMEARKQELGESSVRAKLAGEMASSGPATNLSQRWHTVAVNKVSQPEHREYEGKSIDEIARLKGKASLDALLDLALAEGLETTFEESNTQGDEAAVREIFHSPYVMLGQSDAGAHVASGNPGFGFGTIMLGYWVRERGIMPLEDAIRKLTFMPASIFGIHDRGLLRPGMAADMFVFDPATIDLQKPRKVSDLPEGAPRFVQGARGIQYSIVNGSLVMANGAHTGAYPGKVLRSEAL